MASDPNAEPTSHAGGFPSAARGGGGLTVEECETMIRRSLRVPMVRFLKKHLEKSGCEIGSNFIKARHCEQAAAGGYVSGDGIIVCSNHLQMQDEVTQVVIHELIHAYDDCRAANLDWSDCAHHACRGISSSWFFSHDNMWLLFDSLGEQIRAGHLSGDCHYKRELLRGFLKIRGHEQDCVRRRVMQSLAGNPNCSETAAKDAMEAVWDICYNDTKPFDRAP